MDHLLKRKVPVDNGTEYNRAKKSRASGEMFIAPEGMLMNLMRIERNATRFSQFAVKPRNVGSTNIPCLRHSRENILSEHQIRRLPLPFFFVKMPVHLGK
jgi:hypothetical protein